MGATVWQDMSKVLIPVKSENFSIRQFELTERILANASFRDTIKMRREVVGQQPGIITQLIDNNGDIIMSDTEMERRTNSRFVWKAHGNVLIGGLGLGMVLLAIQDKPDVDSITVVEIEQEVIDLVAPQLSLNEKVNIICDDIFIWTPAKGVLYDTIYFDIWNESGAGNYEDMKRLNRRFGRRLNRSNSRCYMSSWRYDEVKRLALYWRRCG